jgi:hypothetical protein
MSTAVRCTVLKLDGEGPVNYLMVFYKLYGRCQLTVAMQFLTQWMIDLIGFSRQKISLEHNSHNSRRPLNVATCRGNKWQQWGIEHGACN